MRAGEEREAGEREQEEKRGGEGRQRGSTDQGQEWAGREGRK